MPRVVERVNAGSIAKHIFSNVESNSKLMTDELAEYKWLGYNHYQHGVVRHSAKEYVRGSVHTNNIEGFWSHLKRGINGVYLHVSKGHLQKYCDEFAFRFNTRTLADMQRFDKFLTISCEKITYKELKLA